MTRGVAIEPEPAARVLARGRRGRYGMRAGESSRIRFAWRKDETWTVDVTARRLEPADRRTPPRYSTTPPG